MADGRVRRRRRRWTALEKQAIVAEASAPGASVSVVARRYDINANLLFKWLREARRRGLSDGSGFLAVDVVPQQVPSAEAEAETPASPAGRLDIELPCGTRIRCEGAVDEQALARVFRALGHRP